MAAVIVAGGRVLAHACNGPIWGQHAELRAITRCAQEPLGATIFVARSTGGGLAKPCLMCSNAILGAGIRRIVYSTDLGYNVEDL